MKLETTFKILNVVCIGLVILGAAWAMLFIGIYKGMVGMQQEAVDHGAGEWCIQYDGKYENLQRVFRWKNKP